MVKQLVLSFEEFKSVDELSADEKKLFARAREASQQAYAPYSKFKVGCALLLENGEVVTGNNQENAAYPLGLCAERVAFFHAGSNHKGVKIIQAAVYAESELFTVSHPISPCGACRQTMSEYEGNQGSPISLIMGGQSGPLIKTQAVVDLLPLLFGKASLNL